LSDSTGNARVGRTTTGVIDLASESRTLPSLDGQDPPAGDLESLLDALAREVHDWATTVDSARERLARCATRPPRYRAAAIPTNPIAPSCREDIVEVTIANAAHEVTLVDPGVDPSGWPANVGPALASAIDRGCRVRVPLGSPLSELAHETGAASAEIRLGRTPDAAILLADDSAVVACTAEHSPVRVTEALLVRLLRDFADLAWREAAPLTWRTSQAGEQLSPDHAPPQVQYVQHQILRLLVDGAKDETIARHLGMSVRTCRRHIADIMAKLGSVSRFQAGANAVRCGLAGFETTVARPPT